MRVIKRSWFFLPTVGVLIVVLGCTGAASTSQNKQAPSEIHFLRRQKQGGSLMALGGGKLTLVDGCFRIIGELESTGKAIAWPYDFNFRRKDGRIEILNGQNQVVARVGDEIMVGGGGTELWYRGQIKTNEPGPNRCAGPYWAAGYDVTVIKP